MSRSRQSAEKGCSVMRVRRTRPIAVRPAPGKRSQGCLILAHGVRPAALGRSGIRALKREGDGGTPLGRFPIRQVLYRVDRGPRPRTELPVRTIREDDGWCDDPSDRNYNRLITLPSKRSAEGLKRARPPLRSRARARLQRPAAGERKGQRHLRASCAPGLFADRWLHRARGAISWRCSLRRAPALQSW